MDEYEAYRTFGLSPLADMREVDKLYQLAVQRGRSKKLRGALDESEERQLGEVVRAYRCIVQEQLSRRAEEFREARYGKFKRFARSAERIDHFLYYYKSIMIVTALTVIAAGLFVRMTMALDQPADAAAVSPDLSIVRQVDGELLATSSDSDADATAERQLAAHFPDLRAIEVVSLAWPAKQGEAANSSAAASYRLFTLEPDLYLVDRESFSRLLVSGYLLKLEEWDTYGVDLSNGPLRTLWPSGSEPWIAAVRVDAEHPEHALRFIRRFYAAVEDQPYLP